ncbi:hypothetical protein AB0F91_45155 [Amycolatopsis sp. NPDC023774]|uniref:hypothetical protein n=1 Tax=Amycolatopsis sp. NPDC023774 TaxID=3155015 RepID=UPI0033DF3927
MHADCDGATHGKESRGYTFLLDGALHHKFAALGNIGQVIRKTNNPVAVANRMGVPGAETVGVPGSLCIPLDLRALDVRLPSAEIGDLVAVFRAGAYRMDASPTAFLVVRRRGSC